MGAGEDKKQILGEIPYSCFVTAKEVGAGPKTVKADQRGLR